MDLAIVACLNLSFATLVTAHLGIAAGLLLRRRPGRALLGLVVPPLAPYWAFVEDMRVRAAAWLVGLIVYVGSVLAAS